MNRGPGGRDRAPGGRDCRTKYSKALPTCSSLNRQQSVKFYHAQAEVGRNKTIFSAPLTCSSLNRQQKANLHHATAERDCKTSISEQPLTCSILQRKGNNNMVYLCLTCLLHNAGVCTGALFERSSSGLLTTMVSIRICL